MARDVYLYRQIAVQSEEYDGRLEIYPLSGQAYPPDLLVHCSSRMRDRAVHPPGTCFLVNAKLTDRMGGQSYLYVWHGDDIKVMSEREVEVFLEAYRRVRL